MNQLFTGSRLWSLQFSKRIQCVLTYVSSSERTRFSSKKVYKSTIDTLDDFSRMEH